MNERNEPETFAAAKTEMDRHFCRETDAIGCRLLDRPVAAHEREVAELRETAASLNLQLKERDNDCFEFAASEIKRKDATIAELKEALRKCKADLCRACQCLEPRNRCIDCCETIRLARAALENTEGDEE